MLKLLDLFSGIGGFSLGLERSGYFKTVAFCEIETFPRKVLKKHWPDVPIYEDVRTLTAAALRRDGIIVDAICGGFPCQDISVLGSGAGLSGERSGLWYEYSRLISEIRPRFVIVENVAELLNRGMGDVLGTVASLGFDAEWHCIPAAYVGKPHDRDRVWIIAYPNDGAPRSGRFQWHKNLPPIDWARLVFARGSRADHGIPDWVDRVATLGNAVVPQIPELIGRAIGEAMSCHP